MTDTNLTTVLLYGKTVCPYCKASKNLLEKNGYIVNYINLDDDQARKEFYEKMTKELGGPILSMPQIFIGEKYIGGYSALVEYIKLENSVTFDSEF